MKLIKAEHPEKGIWYFSTQRKCAKYIGVQDTCVARAMKVKGRKTNGWGVEIIDDDNIISKYIDPER